MSAKIFILAGFCAGLGACMPLPSYNQAAGAPHSSGVSAASGAGAPSSGDPSAPPSASPGSPSSAPAGPVSVTIRSSCPSTVNVFFGTKPGFGSGTYSSVETNSVSNHSFQPGEMMWIVDGDQNGVASATVSPTTSEIDVGSSCKDLEAH
jgi:hypothetical protein